MSPPSSSSYSLFLYSLSKPHIPLLHFTFNHGRTPPTTPNCEGKGNSPTSNVCRPHPHRHCGRPHRPHSTLRSLQPSVAPRRPSHLSNYRPPSALPHSLPLHGWPCFSAPYAGPNVFTLIRRRR
ncbi:unnamed protein product [Sphenostylis stenocarpa]|uniref:Uncharacterized protein n=1 Tax=Sphenostylis stenocarpa TaxID=92480 RepID=A0AA86V9N0_9FABA|nr:unnamed protein product [Sphenostylis stenocarpa]